jgi:hypothetical protein
VGDAGQRGIGALTDDEERSPQLPQSVPGRGSLLEGADHEAVTDARADQRSQRRDLLLWRRRHLDHQSVLPLREPARQPPEDPFF